LNVLLWTTNFLPSKRGAASSDPSNSRPLSVVPPKLEVESVPQSEKRLPCAGGVLQRASALVASPSECERLEQPNSKKAAINAIAPHEYLMRVPPPSARKCYGSRVQTCDENGNGCDISPPRFQLKAAPFLSSQRSCTTKLKQAS
jgi:hypothetical protein